MCGEGNYRMSIDKLAEWHEKIIPLIPEDSTLADRLSDDGHPIPGKINYLEHITDIQLDSDGNVWITLDNKVVEIYSLVTGEMV